MVTITIDITEELHTIMKKHPEIKWKEIARKAIWKHAKDLELLDKIISKSTMTMEDVMELDDIIKEGMWKKHKEIIN
ncbi:MAG: hypothetical protein ACE5J9_04200 [Methanosarcinales archaeon]